MFIGIDVGGTHIRCALTKEPGGILYRRKAKTGQSPLEVEERLILECRALMESAERLGGRVAGAGLGVAGKIDRREGRILFSPNLPALKDYPLAPHLEENLGIPVFMENDANMFGIGESLFGSGRGIRNWIGLTLGTGVGGCLIFENRLWCGDDLGFSGEIGHMIVKPDGPPCVCGLRGCLEAYSSGRALREGVQAAAQAGELTGGALYERWREGSLTPECVYKSAKQGDGIALRLFEKMGWALGLAVANLFTVLGIRHAIIGGGVSAGWDLFIDPLRLSLASHSTMLDAGRMVILRTALGDDAALLGAAFLAKQEQGRSMGAR